MIVSATIWFNRRPDQRICRVPAPWSSFCHAIQLLSIGFAIAVARVLGLKEMSGVAGLIRLARQETPRPEPEAQGSRLQDDALLVTGSFRITRHPLSLVPVGFFRT